jgi:hypothetical protein
MGFLKKLFVGRKKERKMPKSDFSQEQYDKDYEDKKKGLEHVLGEMHHMVGHAVIPFTLGGAVDMYYFPKHIQGTGFATMELLDSEGNGPKPNRIGTYELVAFTKQPYNENDTVETSFNLIERRICGIFTVIGNYSFQAILNPNETCEIPYDEEANKCVVFDNYEPDNRKFKVGNRKHHLLLCLEVFRSEMDFARENGTEELLERLKDAGYYPYSDLDRKPVA